jgi:signal transduction histidine kinase
LEKQLIAMNKLEPAKADIKIGWRTQEFEFMGLMQHHGILIEINQSALDFGGLTSQEVVGLPCWEAHWWSISKENQAKVKEAIAQAATDEFIKFTADVLAADHSVASCNFVIRPIKDEQGQTILLILKGNYVNESKIQSAENEQLNTQKTTQLAASIYQQQQNTQVELEVNINQRQQAELTLQQRAEELTHLNKILAQTTAILQKRNQELDQFAYIASHDLKAPLRAIASLSEWLEEDLGDQLPPDNQHQMHLLRGRVRRMEALINGLLEYSRVGRIHTESSLVNVGVLLQEVIDSLQPPPTFVIDIPPGMPTLRTKRLLLQQVFANLIGNAIQHHSQPGGNVKISVQDQGMWYEFAVADDGPGIAPEYHDKIFVIFQTLESRDHRENTGIGLAIVKKIVETAGGTITLESFLGTGSTFRFTWPKHPDG